MSRDVSDYQPITLPAGARASSAATAAASSRHRRRVGGGFAAAPDTDLRPGQKGGRPFYEDLTTHFKDGKPIDAWVDKAIEFRSAKALACSSRTASTSIDRVGPGETRGFTMPADWRRQGGEDSPRLRRRRACRQRQIHASIRHGLRSSSEYPVRVLRSSQIIVEVPFRSPPGPDTSRNDI